MPNNPITNQDLLNLAKDIKSDLSSGNIKLSPKFQSPLIEAAPAAYGFGESKFDTSDISISHLQEEGALGDIRGQKQGALDKWANGITKAAGIAGTSILENTAGLLYGIGDAVIEQDLSKIYDNHFTRELDSFNNYLREQMPNYSTKVAEDYNILQKLGTTNFWSDQFLSGVAYSGAALATGYGLNKFASLAKLARAGVVIDEAKLAAEGSAYLDKISRGIKIADATDFAKNAALMSHAESAIEARETKDSTKEQLIKDFTTKYGYEPDEKALKTIEDISNAAGNWGYVSNLAITGTTNALQFPKLLAKGYVANKTALNNIELQGEKFVAEQLNPTTELLKKMSQGVVTEGGQELSQLFSNKVLTDYYGRGFKDKKDQHDLVESIMVGFEQTLGTQEGWENFLLGALIGGPMQMRGAKSDAQDKNVRSQKVASLLNNPEIQKTIKNFDNFVRSSSYEKDKNDALIEGSKFDYLTAEFNQDKAIAKQFIDNNATDLLIKQYQDLSGMSEEEFKKLAGYEENKPLPKSQTEIINNAVNLVKEMDKAVTDIKTLFPYSEEKYSNPTNYDILTTNLWHYSTSINNVNKRVKDINNELFKIAADNNISIIDTKSGFAIEDNPLAAQQVNLLNQDLIKANILKKALVESYNKLANPETQKAALEEIVKDAEVKAEESKQKVEDSKPIEQKAKEQVQTKKTEEGTISPNLYEEKIKLAKTEGELDLINDDLVEQDKHSPELTDLIAQKRVELQLNKPTEGSLEENLQTTIDENTIEQPPIPTLTPKVISKLKDNEDKTLDTHQQSGVSSNKGKFRTNQKTTVTNFAYLSYQYSTANEDEFTETLTTKFDDKGVPIRDKSDLILSTPEIGQGTELEFKIDTSYPNFEELSKSKDTTPIAIYLKGGDSPIAYVHTPEWVKKNVANDYIDQVLFETNEIRKQVFESDKPVEGIIKGKSIGRLNKIENQGEKNNLGYVNSPIEVLGKQSETNPNEFESGRIIVAKSQNTAIIGKNSQSKNLLVNDLIPGAVYLEIPTSLKDNYFATFVKVGTLKDINQTEVILKAIEQHLTKTGQKVNGYDLNTPKGLFDFIGELTFVGKGQKRDAQTLDFNITDEALFLNIGATKDIGFNFKSSVEKNLEKFNSVKADLTNVLDNKYFNVKADKLDSKKEFKIFKVEGNILVEDKTYKNYTEYLAKEILKSNIHPEFYGDIRTFFHQSNISFGLKEESKGENKELPKDEQKDIEEKLNLALEEDVDEDSLFGDNNESINELPDFKEYSNQVDYRLKLIDALEKLQRNKFESSKLQGWLNDLTKQGVSKEQLEIFKSVAKESQSKNDIISGILSEMSYTIEIETARGYNKTGGEQYGEPEEHSFTKDGWTYTYMPQYDRYTKFNNLELQEIASSKEEFEAVQNFVEGEKGVPTTQYYSNLTVVGGTNYTENEIAIPQIVPSIKGHAQFSTDNGIGWFRSDDRQKLTDPDATIEDWIYEKTKTRRILEVQSDLFQKGRDQKYLSGKITVPNDVFTISGIKYHNTYNEFLDIWEDDKGNQYVEEEVKDLKISWLQQYYLKNNVKNIKENQFLQLLNKDNNWVTFFVKSIIQDSARKGYEKVLFPSGETAAKVEGHETLASEIIKLDKLIEQNKKGSYLIKDVFGKDKDGWGYDGHLLANPEPWNTKEDSENERLQQLGLLENNKKELKSQGIEKLKPIEAFYEIRIKNILKKNYKVNEITDEYGNTWNEVELSKEDLKSINLSPDFSNTNLKYYRIQDLTLEQQNQIIDSLVANINNLIEKDFSPNETFSKTYNQLKASYNNAVKAGNIDKARILKLAIDNWNPSKSFTGFKNLVEIKLAQLGTKIEDNNLQEEDGLIEKRNFSEGATFKVNPKDKASARIKRLLASIPKDEKSVVGLPLFYDYNELYNSLLTYLADTPFNEMVSELQELGTTKPEFRKVYDRLTSLDKSIMNEFLTVMKNRYSEFLTPIADINVNGVSLYFRKSNINSAESLIINNWLETFKSSNILEQVTEGENIGNLKISEAKSKELLSRYNLLLKTKTFGHDVLAEFSKVFKEVGINVSIEALEDLRNNSQRTYNISVDSLFADKLSNIFKTLAGGNKNQTETDILFDKNNPFINEEESLKILARAQKKYEENLINSSFKNATGNSVFAYNNPTYLTDQLLELNNPEYIKQLEATPFASTSYYLEELAKPESDFKKVFHISYLDAFRKAKSNEEAIEYSDMSKKLRELTKIALFQNQGKQTTNITGLTYSDKDQTTIVSVPRIDIGTGVNAWKDVDSEAFNHLRALAIGELKRISLTQQQINTLPKEQLIEGYHKGAKGGLIAFLFTKLNNSEILFPNGELVEDWADSNKEIYKLEIDTIIKQEVESWISDKMNTWIKEGLYNSYEDNLFDKSYLKGGKLGIRTKTSSNDDVLEYAASDYVINYAIANGNLIQILHGDLALAGKKGSKTEGYIRNTYVNYFKRLAKDIAPGVESPNTESKTSVLYLKDVDFRNEYVNKFFADDKSKKINGTDAQGIITTQHYLTKLFERGLIKEPIFNSMISKIKEFPNNYDAKFTNEERAVIFQPRKPVYVKGNIENGVNKIVYLKLSDYPLLPSLTKNTKLDNLRKLMESENGVDLAIFESGAKLGMQKATSLYDDKGNWVLTKDDIINNRVYLDSTGFKIQQDNPLKDSKKILEATQQRKLLFVDIPENVEFTFESKTVNKKDLKKKFDDLHIELLEQKFNNLLEEFNIKTDDKGQYSIESMTKFHEFIMKEAIDREWNPNELASIQLDKDNKTFVLNLMYLPNAEKLESLFTSILTNNVVKNKLPGHSYIQGSSIGYESAEKNVFSDPEYKYMQKDESGYYSEVAIAWPYKNLKYSDYVNEDGTPKTEMFDKEMLYLIGYRIPNQGHNSMSRLKIKRFLRPKVGDLMLVPSEITLQMGSDFDVDKMYSYTYNHKMVDGKITKYKFDEQEIRDLYSKKNDEAVDKLLIAIFGEEYKEAFLESDEQNIQNLIKKAKQKVIENSIVEVNDSVLSNEYLKDKIEQPLGFDALQEAVDKIGKLNKQRTSEYSILYDETSDVSYVANKSGKLLTGTTSLSATNHALAQEAHLYIKRNPKNDTEVSVLFKDDNDKVYEDKEKYAGAPSKGAWRLDKTLGFSGTPISFVISGLQSAAVDNAKEQLMGKANINKHTYGVGALIARTGFDEEFIVAFLNQDVIHTMVDELEKLNDPTQDFSKKIKKKDLLTELQVKYEKLAGIEAIDEIRAFSKQEMFNMLSYETQKQQGNIAPEKLDALEKFYNLGQAQILYNFIKYDEVASELTTIQNALTPETQGVGKSMSEMLYKQAQIEKVQLGGKYIANVDNLFNKTYIGQVIDKAIFKGNSIFKNLYPYSDKSYNFIEESIVEQIGDDRQLSSEELDKIYKEVKSSLFTKDGLFTSDIENERLRLLIDTFTLNKGVKTFSTKSLAQRLFEYKGNNPFFKKLSTELTIKSGEPSYVLYNASLVEEDTESFQNSINWQEALKSGNLEEKQLAEDLVLYAYLTGGVQTKSSFVKFVPAEYLIEKIGTKKIVDFSDPTAFVYITKQFFQHNPWRARQIKQDWSQVNLKEKGLPESFTVSRNQVKSSSLLIEYKNEVKLPEYLSYKTKDKWLLYEKTGISPSGHDVYERVNTLGGFNLKEYNINQDNDKSVISSNNPVKVKSKPETKGADLNNNQIEQVQPIASNDTILTQMIEKNQLGNALEYIENLGGRYGVLAGVLKDKISGLHTSIDTSISSKGQQEGSQIKINPNNNDNLEQLSDTILHETLHGITVGKIEAFEQGDFTKLTQSEIDTLESLKTLMKLSKSKIKDFEGKQNKLQEYIKKYRGLDLSPNEIEEAKQLVNEVYGLTNLKEFVTMSMTNKVFQGVLNEIPFGKKTLLDRFLDLIKKLVGFEVKAGSVLEQTINDVLTLIETKSENPLVSTNELIDLNGNKVTKLTDYIKSVKSISREDIMDILITNKVANTKTGQLLMTIGDRTQEQKNAGYRGDKYYENKKKLQYVQREFPGLLDLTETPNTYKIAIRQDFIDKFNSGTQLTLNLSPSFKTKTTGDLGLDKYISKWDNQIRILKGQKTKNPEQAAEKQAAIDVLEKRKSELIEEKSIDLIFDTANVQLKQVEELLKQDEQTEESLQKALNYIAGWEDIGEIFDFEPNSDNAKVLGEIITSSVYLRKKWSEAAKQYLTERAKTIRPEWTYDKLFKEQIDTSFGSSMFFDSSVSSVAIEQFLDKLIKDTSFRINSEVDEKSKEIDDKIKAIGGKKAFTKLLQTYENGKLTGNLVSPIKQEYYDKVKKLRKDIKGDSKKWKQYWDFVKSNSYILTTEEAKSGKSAHFTQKEIDKQLELLDIYEKQRVKFIEEEKEKLSYSSSYIDKENNEQQELDYQINLADNIKSWERENSPYLREQYEREVFEGKRKERDLKGMKGHTYLVYPKPKEQWQDPKYKALTKEQLEFLEYFKDTIEEYLKFLPVESDIQSNYIPEIRKGLIERIISDKNTKILSGIGASFVEKITTDFISEREYGVIDEETGKPIRQLRTGMLAGKLSADEKSYDLGSVLKEFVFMASAIKYKSEVEFQVTLGEKLLNEIEEQAVSPDGIKRDWQNNPIKITNGLNNTKERVNYLIDTFYGIRKDIEGVSKEIKSGPLKGKRLAGSKIGDSINQLTTAKGLALNPFSGMVNLFFGKISNRIHASSNQEFGDGDLNKAEAIVATSIFNSKGTKEKLALLMDKLQVLGDINHANYGGKSSFDKLYIFQRMGEFMVQAEAMTAILIKNDLWSKVEVKDGQLVFPDGFTEKDIIALSDKIQQTIKYLHGNYQINSPTRIKKHIWGRMLMVFRNWIPYSLQNRFGREMVDYRLGRTKKGRYITYGTLGFTGSMKTLLKLSVLGKVTGQKLEGVSEVDEANMRQNLRELSYMATMYLMTMLLSGLAKGTDDDDEKAVYTYFLNMASRTESDIWFYVSPKAFNQIIKDPIPSLKTFNDFVKLVNSTGHWVIGDDEIKYGKHKGESGLVRSFKKAFPLSSQLVNLETLSEKAFE